MNKVEQIIERSRVTLPVNGTDYVMRKVTSAIAMRVLGSKGLGIIRGAKTDPEREVNAENQADIIRQYLTVCSVSPIIGDVTDPENDKIAYEDMGGDEDQLFLDLMVASGMEAPLEDFTESSEGGTD